jgi:hypothetical protein
MDVNLHRDKVVGVPVVRLFRAPLYLKNSRIHDLFVHLIPTMHHICM